MSEKSVVFCIATGLRHVYNLARLIGRVPAASEDESVAGW